MCFLLAIQRFGFLVEYIHAAFSSFFLCFLFANQFYQSILLSVIPALPALYDGARFWISEGWIRFVVYALCGFICCDMSVEDSIRVLIYGFFIVRCCFGVFMVGFYCC